MTEQWIRDNLPVQEDDVVLETSAFGSIYTIPVSELAELFVDVEPKYSKLVAKDKTDSLGYKKYLDAWKAQGLLS